MLTKSWIKFSHFAYHYQHHQVSFTPCDAIKDIASKSIGQIAAKSIGQALDFLALPINNKQWEVFKAASSTSSKPPTPDPVEPQPDKAKPKPNKEDKSSSD